MRGSYNTETHKLWLTTSCPEIIQSDTSFSCLGNCTTAGTCSDRECTVRHKYREYRDYIPKWNISTQDRAEGSQFWHFLVNRFGGELVQYWNENYPTEPIIVLPDIPEEWKVITEEETLRALRG